MIAISCVIAAGLVFGVLLQSPGRRRLRRLRANRADLRRALRRR